jgi:hypothetical protein
MCQTQEIDPAWLECHHQATGPHTVRKLDRTQSDICTDVPDGVAKRNALAEAGIVVCLLASLKRARNKIGLCQVHGQCSAAR